MAQMRSFDFESPSCKVLTCALPGVALRVWPTNLQASYGKSNLENIMIIFMMCGNKCADHKKPLPKQIDTTRRVRCLRALLDLSDLPACYNAAEFGDYCRRELKACMQLSATGTRFATPPTPVTPARAAVPRRFNHQTDKRSPGRPRLNREERTVYCYYKDDATPFRAEALCIVDSDGVARFRFDLPEVRAEVIKSHILGPSGMRRKFDVWDNTKRHWIPAPKASEEQLLLPGEGRIYRVRGVEDLVSFEMYQKHALPRVQRNALDPTFMTPIPSTSNHTSSPSSHLRSTPVPEPPSSPSSPCKRCVSSGSPSTSEGESAMHTPAAKKRRVARDRIADVLGIHRPNSLPQEDDRKGPGRAPDTFLRPDTSADSNDWELTDEQIVERFWST
ncbi:hypothetical protein C8Q76DRAFT_803789 [Earliella scabrosa]|nr:hypothetical protein C8Q76DRAFT_803789 [Earliella scabrosa]